MNGKKYDHSTHEEIIVSRLNPESYNDFKTLRLESLRVDSQAFGSSYEEEINFVEEIWKSRIVNMLFAIYKNKLAGMIGFLPRTRIKTGHVADIFSFYVCKEYRGLGIGWKLLNEALLEIRNNQKIIKISLSVNSEMEAAIHLYKKCGFNISGRLERELKLNGNFYDEFTMEKLIQS
ncbi:MAG: GNAT family N-acetyltransferase [Candidatus Thermoplasmatota archaeon]|nr:GNAT family N-acetyltransferase [Candidatus Thermoplasmatota archaeon]